jgi:hypothetical protein
LRPKSVVLHARIFRGFALVQIDTQIRFVVRVDEAVAKCGQAREHVEQGLARTLEFLNHEIQPFGARLFLHPEIARG